MKATTVPDRANPGRLREERIEGRNVLVSLQEDGNRPRTREHPREQAQHGVRNVRTVSVDDEPASRARRHRFTDPMLSDFEPFVTGHVDLHDAVERRVTHPLVHVEAEVLGVNVRVVHIEQETTVRRRASLAEKLGLPHLGAAWMPVIADVFDREWPPDGLPSVLDAIGDTADVRLLEGDRQELVQNVAPCRAEAEVVRMPRSVDRVDDLPQVGKIGVVERVRPADGHRETVGHDRIPLREPCQLRGLLAPASHVVLRRHLQKVDRGGARSFGLGRLRGVHESVEKLPTQPEADAPNAHKIFFFASAEHVPAPQLASPADFGAPDFFATALGAVLAGVFVGAALDAAATVLVVAEGAAAAAAGTALPAGALLPLGGADSALAPHALAEQDAFPDAAGAAALAGTSAACTGCG